MVALTKCSSETIGLCQLGGDWGEKVVGKVYSDSTAAIGITRRKGAWKLRHIRIGLLWVQESGETGVLGYGKVGGNDNPADLLTKNVGVKVAERHMARMGGERRLGRAEQGLVA